MTSTRALILYLVEAPNGKRYIGITSRSIADRWFEHLQESRASRANRAISNAIRKYGAHSFMVSELARAESWQALCAAERQAIEQYGTFAPEGYNLTRGGDGFTGQHSVETRQKMRAAHLARPPRTEEHRRNLSIALTGKRHPPEVIAKILATKRGRPFTDAQHRGLASMHAKNLGRVPSVEHRQKISAAKKGRPNPKLIGRLVSAESRAKISAAHSGKPLSAAHRAKLTAAWARRRMHLRSSNHPQQELFN
jgi:group I intron endonuclease